MHHYNITVKLKSSLKQRNFKIKAENKHQALLALPRYFTGDMSITDVKNILISNSL